MKTSSQPIIWCCPFCQRMFDVGCCPEHRALERYTPTDNEQAKEMAAQRVSARGPVQQEGISDGRSSG